MQALVFPSSSHIEHVDSVLMQNVSNPSFSTIKLDLAAPKYERENVRTEIFGTWMRLISTRRRRSPSHGLSTLHLDRAAAGSVHRCRVTALVLASKREAAPKQQQIAPKRKSATPAEKRLTQGNGESSGWAKMGRPAGLLNWSSSLLSEAHG